MVPGKLPPGKFPPIKLPPGKFPPRIFLPMFLNIPTQVLNFFVFSLLSPLPLILLKRLFRDSIFKIGEVRLVALKKFVACRPFIYLKKGNSW